MTATLSLDAVRSLPLALPQTDRVTATTACQTRINEGAKK
jgi:hypothetical protein